MYSCSEGMELLVEMDDIGELDGGDTAEALGEGMDEEVARHALVIVPGDVARFGVDDKALDDAVAAVDLEQNLDVQLLPPLDVEADLAPAQEEDLFEIVLAREGCAKLAFDGGGVLFGELGIDSSDGG